MGESLFSKVWDLHAVRELPTGQTQLFIGLHLIHEGTSPQGFQMLYDAGLEVLYPERTFATVDHIVPTDTLARPLADELAEQMLRALERNTERSSIELAAIGSGRQSLPMNSGMVRVSETRFTRLTVSTSSSRPMICRDSQPMS